MGMRLVWGWMFLLGISSFCSGAVKARGEIFPDSVYIAAGSVADSTRAAVQIDSTNLRELQLLVEKGDPNALVSMGMLYELGWGVPVDHRKAYEYYRRSAEKGNPTALNELGVLYEKGEIVEKNDSLAARYYSLSAEKEIPLALYNLGRFYRMGAGGFSKNPPLAMNYFRRSGAKGVLWAWQEIGSYYESGRDTVPDLSQAAAAYRTGAEGGNRECQYRLGIFFYQGKGGLPADSLQALYWCGLSADQGYDPAIYYVANAFMEGRGINRDIGKAIFYFKLLAQKNEVTSQVNLAVCLHLQNKDAEAMQWMERAGVNGNLKAQLFLGKSYLAGMNGVAKDVQKGKYWIARAAEGGCSEAQCALGQIYLRSDSIALQREGVALLIRAAKQGVTKANVILGQYFAGGYGCPPKDFDSHISKMLPFASKGKINALYSLAGSYCAKLDFEQVRYWLLKAASTGESEAKLLLELLPE